MSDLILPKYDVIYSDPPRQYDDPADAGQRGAGHKYEVMKIEDIISLPVHLMANPNCALFMWVTSPLLDRGIEALKGWGFDYVNIAFTWVKTTKLGKEWHWGMGHYTRQNPEHVLFGKRGKVKPIVHNVHSIIKAPVGAHSAKPPEVRTRIEKLLGDDKKRIELFARQAPKGWDVVGLHINDTDIRDVLKRYEERNS